MSYTDPFSPESILRPENLFGVVVAWRKKILPESSSDALNALNAMEHIHPEREHKNRKLFISRLAQNTDFFAHAGDVVSTHTTDAFPAPIRQLTPEQIMTNEAHLAYVNDLSAQAERGRPPIPDNVIRMSEARNAISGIYQEAA